MATEAFVWDGTASKQRKRTPRILLTALVTTAAFLCLGAPAALATTPGVNTLSATSVDYTTATLNGDVNPNGGETKAYFEYGTTVAYGSKTAEVNVGSGSSPVERSQAVSGLSPNTIYHYRIVATNPSGTALGGDRTFATGWTVQTTATPESPGQLYDVSCTSPSECTAVGTSTAQRWDGSKWKTQAGAGGLIGVSCVSSAACFAVGGTVSEFWNGTEWKAKSTPSPAGTPYLRDVSCVSATDCTAVGNYTNSGPPQTQKTLAMHWDGTEWKLQTTPNPAANEAYLVSVSCTSSIFCMATGYYYESPSGPWAPLSMRWNGTEWTIKAPQKPAGATMSWLYGVSCTAATECTAVGQKEVNAETHENQTVAQRWDGAEWKLQTTPNPEASNRRFEDVSCASPTACTATGSYSNGLGEELPFSLRWNGTAWTLQAMATPAGGTKALPHAVSCIASRGCEVVGQYRNAASAIVPLAEGYWRSALPTVTTKAATGVAEKSATLNGTVNPNGSETKIYFEYGTTTAYGSKASEANAGSGTSVVEKSVAISGLSPNTTYHYRAVANNENPEPGNGADMTFTTIGPPEVVTGAGEPDPATGKAATLNGSVDPNGQSTTYQFEYGTSPGSYSTTVPIPAESAGSEMSGKAVSCKIIGLTRGTKYYFRVTATNASGKVNGIEKSFVTQDVPGATTQNASEVKWSKATLNASINSNGLATKYQFEYGTTVSYGSKAPLSPVAAPESGSVSQPVSGLAAKTTYHYRVVAENAFGTTYGADKAFTTLPTVTLYVGGKSAAVGAPLKVTGPSLKFASIECTGTEFSGEISENPGALQSVSTAKAQGPGGAMCKYSLYDIKFEIPTKGITVDYTTDEAAEKSVVKWSKFTLAGTVFLFGAPVGTCEYAVEMTGSLPFAWTAAFSAAGTVNLVKTAGTCPPSGTVSGKISLKSGESSVEAKL